MAADTALVRRAVVVVTAALVGARGGYCQARLRVRAELQRLRQCVERREVSNKTETEDKTDAENQTQ